MRKIKVEEAVGQTLCHDMTAILENGYKGVRFKRGHLISEEDIPVLKDMGKDHILLMRSMRRMPPGSSVRRCAERML